jgi:hypothetical protein
VVQPKIVSNHLTFTHQQSDKAQVIHRTFQQPPTQV